MTETTTQMDEAREWAEAWLEDNPECRLADLAEVVGAVYGDEVGNRAACAVWFADDPESNPHKPLAVADIPAGQGAASLFIHVRGGNEPTAVRFKAHDERIAPVLALPAYRTVDRALWDHLAATLPTVTDATEESK